MNRMRWSDKIQLYLLYFAVIFITVTYGLVFAQTQEAINARFDGNFQLIFYRLDKLEVYFTAAIVGIIANFIAHIINIRSQAGKRRGQSSTSYRD